LAAEFKLGHYQRRVLAPFHPRGPFSGKDELDKIRNLYMSGERRSYRECQMSNPGRNLLIAIITAVICGILLYAAIRY
jgi:hypothetical protein